MEVWPRDAIATALSTLARDSYYGEGQQHDNHSWTDNEASESGVDVSSSNESGTGDNSVQVNFYEQLLAHPDIRMRDDLLRYVTPVLIVFGNFSNLLALIVLRRKNLRPHSVCFYMTAYAVANILVLELIMGITWLCFVLEKTYIGSITDWSCRLWTFISNVIIYCGIWFVVVLTIDRFIYLCQPRKAASYCTVFTAKFIVLTVLVGLLVISIHAMWTFDLQPQGCFVSSEQQDLHTLIWPWWSASIYSYLPLAMLFFINIVLSVSLCLKRHRQRRSQQVEGADDFAITTLVISSSFFLLTVPATIINIIDIHFPSSMLSIDLIAGIELTKKVTEILSSINHTLLGVILMIFSRAFRQEVFSMAHSLHFKRRPRVYEMCNVSANDGSNNDTGDGNGHVLNNSSRIEYELCNSSGVTSV